VVQELRLFPCLLDHAVGQDSGLVFVVWSFLILIIAINLYIAKRLSPGTGLKDEGSFASQVGLSANTLNLIFLAFILIASFVIASKASDKWNMVLRYLYWQPFGSADPIFNRDIGFYVFALPFYAFIRSGLLILFVLAGGLTIIWYLKNGALQVIGEIVQVEGKPPSLPKIKSCAYGQKAPHIPRRNYRLTLGMGVLPEDLRSSLFHLRSRLWRRLYGCSHQNMGLQALNLTLPCLCCSTFS